MKLKSKSVFYSGPVLALFCLVGFLAVDSRMEASFIENIQISTAGTGAISGRVTDLSGTGIPNLEVRAYDWMHSLMEGVVVQTDSSGNYTITGLSAGTYYVGFGVYLSLEYPHLSHNWNYLEEWYNDKSAIYSATPVFVSEGKTTADINAQLAAGGQISGRVTNASGAGIPDVGVAAYGSGYQLRGDIDTDSDGYFTISGLPSGDYKVSFRETIDYYQSKWYADKNSFETADPVATTEGATTPDINVTLTTRGGITGRVTDGAGVGIKNVIVDAYNLDHNQCQQGSTDSDGNYKIAGLATGDYKLEYWTTGNWISEWYNDKGGFETADPVAFVFGSDTTGINAQLAVGGQITGRVVNALGAGLQGAQIEAYDLNQRFWEAAQSEASGSYTISGLPTGNYKVRFWYRGASNSNNQQYFEGWYNAQSNFETSDPVAVTVGATTSGIDARMASGGEISGRVIDSAGAGIQALKVQAYDLNNVLRGQADTDAAGNYAIWGLAAGNYKVFFEPGTLNYFSEWYDDKSDFNAAEAIAVTASGTTANIDAQLAAMGQISGRVTDAAGPGIKRVRIDVFNPNSQNAIASGLTESDGSYVISRLAPGSYKLKFSGPDEVYVAEWYNDKGSFETADAVAVTTGRTTSGVDVELIETGRISGRITDSTGAGIGTIAIWVFDLNGKFLKLLAADYNGNYFVSGVPPGKCKIFFYNNEFNYISEWYNDKGTIETADQIVVTAGNTTPNINAQLAKGVPVIRLSNSSFSFRVNRNATVVPGTQPGAHFNISNAGTGSLNWTATPSTDWISVMQGSGRGDQGNRIFISRTDLAVGRYSGTVAITDPAATNSPQTIVVNLEVRPEGADDAPFGYFETPAGGSTVASSIPVSGWALDDFGVQTVKIYRGTGSADRVYIGDAVFVEGARPDVEAAYPTYPSNDRAGWGYMLLTNFLPNGGNGTITLLAYAFDMGGNETLLGSKTITCDNAHAVKPFGAIDTPAQGGGAYGSSYINFGWALTPPPNSILMNGSTITVWVDGAWQGHPVYNNYRADIATLFPGYANSNGAVGYYYLDTWKYLNGVHTIAWSVSDSGGNTDGIGSRYFTIQNEGGASGSDEISSDEKTLEKSADVSVYSQDKQSQSILSPKTTALRQNREIRSIAEISAIPEDVRSIVFVKRGWSADKPAQAVVPEKDGSIRITIPEVSWVAVYLNGQDAGGSEAPARQDIRVRRISGEAKSAPQTSENSHYEAFELVGEELRPLPIGASFDTNNGAFYWQPGPGFLGEYALVFVKTEAGGSARKTVKISIIPKDGTIIN